MNQKGITIVGLLITVIVIVTIAGVCIYTGRDIFEEAKQTELETNILLIQAAGKTLYDKTILDKNIPLIGTEVRYENKDYYILDKTNLNELGLNIQADDLEDEKDLNEELEEKNSVYLINYETNEVIYLANADLTNISLTGLPSEYQQVEFIESTGAQWIDTEYKPNNTTNVIYDFEYISGNANAYMPILGQRVDYTKMFAFWINSSNNLVAINYCATDTSAIANTDGSGRHIYSNKNNKFYLDDKLIKEPSYNEFQANYSLTIFALNAGTTKETRGLKGRVYSLKIYENETLVRNFIPCYRKSDTVPGLYDLVYNNFYENKGTGTFVIPNS